MFFLVNPRAFTIEPQNHRKIELQEPENHRNHESQTDQRTRKPLCVRCVDDTFTPVQKDKIDAFHADIQFTKEIESKKIENFLP